MRKVGTALLIASLFVLAGNANAQVTFDEASQNQMVMTNMSSMPLAFTENRGQWDEKALFKADAGGATFWFCGDEIAYVFTRNTDELIEYSRSGSDRMGETRHLPISDMPDKFDQPRYKKESLVIRAQLISANPDAEIIGENRLSHNCNYFYGNEPAKWRTDVPNYSSITYKDIYPGIDLKYHGNGQGMKYDFIVNPGADISQIQIRYEGVDNLVITPNGDLEATTLFGPIHENIPSVYQEIGSGKREVTGRYVITAPGVFGFEVDDYNPSLTLVIDPELVYSTYLGGNDYDEGEDIAVDGSGSAYLTGTTWSTDFPTENPYQTDWDYLDVFVTKLSPAGNTLVYSTYLGGNANDKGYGIAVDASGSAYVTGRTRSTDFPTLNPYQTYQDLNDVFVTKLSFSGNSLVYSTYLGGNNDDAGWSIAVDGGCAYVTGRTESADYPTVNPFDESYNGWTDVFVTKLSASGNNLIYSTFLGSDSWDSGYDITVDGDCAFITGQTCSSDFPTVNPFDESYNDSGDVFITKLSATGDNLIYSTFLGGNNEDWGFSIAVDGGCAYVTGRTESADYPTVNSYDDSYNGGDLLGDAFVTKLSVSGNNLIYSTFLGGGNDDLGYSIAVGDSGSTYVTGWTYSSDFPTVDPYDGNLDSNSDVFVTKLSPAGNSLVYSTYLGGSNYDEGLGIAVDGSGSVYVTGYTYSTNFPTENPYDGSLGGYGDAFVTKLSPSTEDIPTLSEWGMVVLALLLLAVGTVAIIRRRKAVIVSE